MKSDESLPHTIEALTPAWLTGALQEKCPGVVVEAITVDKLIPGTTSKLLISARYRSTDAVKTPPEKLCIKGDFDVSVRETFAAMTVTGTQIEALFYNDLAPRLGVPVARHWYGGSEPGMGILILDNLAAENATFGTPTVPWTVDAVSKGLDVLAKLHASTWMQRFPNLPWLKVGSVGVHQACEVLMSEAHWNSKPNEFEMPQALTDRDRLLRGLRAMWKRDDARADCVIHGDAHVANTCIDASGQPFFLDWAAPCYSSWAFDFSTFVVGALTVQDRRSAELEILKYYLGRLAKYGGPSIEWSEAWKDYRRHILNGIIWTTLPATMQSFENVSVLGERFTTALLDHGTLDLLGV